MLVDGVDEAGGAHSASDSTTHRPTSQSFRNAPHSAGQQIHGWEQDLAVKSRRLLVKVESDWEHNLISVVRLGELAVPCTAGAGMAE